MLAVLLVIKIFLDMFVPAREFNFAMTGAIALILVFTARRIFISQRGLMLILTFLFLTFVGSLQTGDWVAGLRWIVLPLFFWGTYIHATGLAPDVRIRTSFFILGVAFLLFAGNLILSMANGMYQTRELWNFEHVNLAGSYILSLAPVCLMLVKSKNIPTIWARLLFVLSALTTSTGALVASLLLLPKRLFSDGRVGAVRLISSLVTVIFILILAWAFVPELSDKISSPFAFFQQFGLFGVIDFARAGGSLYNLGDQYSGSATWRLYAYVVYIENIYNRGIAELLLGQGFGAFVDVFDGYMPHNDFLLVVSDHGILGLAWITLALVSLRESYTNREVWVPLMAIVFLRLVAENNIYSFYLMSAWMGFLALSISLGDESNAHIGSL